MEGMAKTKAIASDTNDEGERNLPSYKIDPKKSPQKLHMLQRMSLHFWTPNE